MFFKKLLGRAIVASLAMVLAASAASWSFPADAVMEIDGREYTADDSGLARVNIIFKKGAAEHGMSEIASGRGRVRHVHRIIPAVTMEIPFEDLGETVAAIKSNKHVVAVEPDYRDQRIMSQTVPWGVTRVQATAVHAGGNKGDGVKVAVVDTGVDYTHPDLAANYRGGYDFVNGDNDPRDDHGHGTHVAGTIAAADNGFGVLGVAPAAEYYALKVLNFQGTGYQSTFIMALEWAMDHGVKVVNYSAGGPGEGYGLAAACQAAYDAGVIIVAAAGNEAGSIIYPAALPTVIAVGAVGADNQHAWFSNIGPQLDVAAPGVNVLSTTVGGGYSDYWSGTSMATPHVAGAVALLAASGMTDAGRIFSHIAETAADLGSPGKDNYYGWGLLNAFLATRATDFLAAPNGGEIIPSGSNFSVQWSSPPDTAKVALYLSTDNGLTWDLIKKDIAGQNFAWKVAPPRRNKGRCRLKAVAKNASNHIVGWDISDGKFAIEVVKLDSPLDGDSFAAGTRHDISWKVNATVSPVRNIRLFWSKDGGRRWRHIADVPPADTSFPWTVPGVLKDKYKCQVKAVLKGAGNVTLGKDKSDPYFAVTVSP